MALNLSTAEHVGPQELIESLENAKLDLESERTTRRRLQDRNGLLESLAVRLSSRKIAHLFFPNSDSGFIYWWYFCAGFD